MERNISAASGIRILIFNSVTNLFAVYGLRYPDSRGSGHGLFYYIHVWLHFTHVFVDTGMLYKKLFIWSTVLYGRNPDIFFRPDHSCY